MKLTEMFKEPSGELSFSRIASFLVLVAWLTWCSYIVWNTRALPGGMWEISAVVGTLYGLNRITDAVKTVATGVDTATPETIAATTEVATSVKTETEK
jgi:hypothetical protein